MEFGPNREATIELTLDDYVNKKVNKMLETKNNLLGNTFNELLS